MTASDDCNMIAAIILNFLATPIAITLTIGILPYVQSGTMDIKAYNSAISNILFGFAIVFLCGMIMGLGRWIDSIDLI